MAAANNPYPDLRTVQIWDIARITGTEEATLDWCQRVGLVRHTPICGHCQIPLAINLTYKGEEPNYRFRCTKKYCRREIPVRSETFFEGSKLTLSTILRLTYGWAMDFWSHEDYKFQLNLADHTVVDWKNFCRDICADYFIQVGYNIIS